ncbi:hypothetical protein [Cellulomonas sp. URHE0023]|uniref:hypothetical protein n=1 Tax=Cellulomonas sp. URHE0023 TaxID=1380354 RepID=UPI000485979F|nr:hypothetical protein [Cellulomonas sp. URHE0023]
MIVNVGEVDADYSQIELGPGFGGHAYGLDNLGLANGELGENVVLTTARQHGRVAVEAQVLERQPPLDPAWDAVVEMSLRTGEGAQVCGWAGTGVVAIPVPPGIDVRVRYVVLDGQIGSEQFNRPHESDESPAERYLLQMWPAPPTAARTLAATSPWSQYWAFGPPAVAIIAELADVPDPDRAVVVIDRALAAHPDVTARLRAGDDRFQAGVVRYLQELFRVTYFADVYEGLRNDHERIRLLIAERARRLSQ